MNEIIVRVSNSDSMDCLMGILDVMDEMNISSHRDIRDEVDNFDSLENMRGYYFDRSERIDSLINHCCDLINESKLSELLFCLLSEKDGVRYYGFCDGEMNAADVIV